MKFMTFSVLSLSILVSKFCLENSLEYLIHHLRTTPHELSLSCDGHNSSDVSTHRHRLVTVGILEDDVWNPEHRHLITIM